MFFLVSGEGFSPIDYDADGALPNGLEELRGDGEDFPALPVTENSTITIECRNGDSTISTFTGKVEVALAWARSMDYHRDGRLYEKCRDCHLFIEPNWAWAAGENIAAFDHLHRGDDADEAIVFTHEATPSGQVAPIPVWREFGPEAMRARFDKES